MFPQPNTARADDAAGREIDPRDIRAALATDELSLAFQPIVAAGAGALTGFEALLRWHHPTHGAIPPVEVIPVAERSSLILDLGDWVLRRACAQAAGWRTRPGGDGPAPTVWVNISARQLEDERFPERVASALYETGLDGSALCLEVTESSLVNVHTTCALAVMSELRSLGVRLALDDFGTGYSSLSYLRHLPIDCLKLDRSFAGQVTSDASVAPILKGVADMAHALGLALVAEGIETEAQLAVVRDCGIDLLQGFLLGRPSAPEQLERWAGVTDVAPTERVDYPADLAVAHVPRGAAPAVAHLLEREGERLVDEATESVYAGDDRGWFGTAASAGARRRWVTTLSWDCSSGTYEGSLRMTDAFLRQAAMAGAPPLEQHLFLTSVRKAITRELRRAGVVEAQVRSAWQLFTALEHRLLLILPIHRSVDGRVPATGDDAA